MHTIITNRPKTNKQTDQNKQTNIDIPTTVSFKVRNYSFHIRIDASHSCLKAAAMKLCYPTSAIFIDKVQLYKYTKTSEYTNKQTNKALNCYPTFDLSDIFIDKAHLYKYRKTSK